MKNRKKYLIINIILLAILFGSISFNKEHLRPISQGAPFWAAILGCFPNFMAAFIVSLFPLGAALSRNLHKGRMIIYSGAFLVFILLSAEELRPFVHASKVFDPLDIVASAVGALMAVATFELIVFYGRSFKTSSSDLEK